MESKYIIRPNEIHISNLDIELLSKKSLKELIEIEEFESMRFFSVNIFLLREGLINRDANSEFKYRWVSFNGERFKLNYINRILFCLKGSAERMAHVHRTNLYERYKFFCTNNDQYECELKIEHKKQIQLLEEKFEKKKRSFNVVNVIKRGSSIALKIKPTFLTLCT